MENRTRRRGLVGPLLLVAAGVFFLLSNLGLVGWDAWQIVFRFWPVLLIALGLEILVGRRSLAGSVAVVVVVIAVIGAALAFFPAYTATSGPVTTETISQPLDGARRAAVDLSYGAGTLRVGALSDSDLLVEGTVSGVDASRLTRAFQIVGDTANFGVGIRHDRGGPFVPGRGVQETWNLSLNKDVPMTVKVNGGVGTAVLDLSQLKVTNLDANLGVGKTTITMPSNGQVQGRINAGVGEVLLIVPSGVGARVQADSGLGGLNVPPSFQKQDNVYVSPDYSTAQNRLDLTVKGGIGRIAIQQ